nr:MAG TPA: hypothetical protein [Caudoviricetes sp.]
MEKKLVMLMLAGEKLNFGFKVDTKEPYTLWEHVPGLYWKDADIIVKDETHPCYQYEIEWNELKECLPALDEIKDVVWDKEHPGLVRYLWESEESFTLYTMQWFFSEGVEGNISGYLSDNLDTACWLLMLWTAMRYDYDAPMIKLKNVVPLESVNNKNQYRDDYYTFKKVNNYFAIVTPKGYSSITMKEIEDILHQVDEEHDIYGLCMELIAKNTKGEGK